MNTLMPAAPGRRSELRDVFGILRRAADPEGVVAMHAAAGARRACRRASSALTVSGLVFGISKTAVTPPITAAREPVSRSSLCSAPGSRKCTCVSMTPGRMVRPGRVDDLARVGGGKIAERGDPAVADADVARADPVVVDDGSAAEEEVEGLRHCDFAPPPCGEG